MGLYSARLRQKKRQAQINLPQTNQQQQINNNVYSEQQEIPGKTGSFKGALNNLRWRIASGFTKGMKGFGGGIETAGKEAKTLTPEKVKNYFPDVYEKVEDQKDVDVMIEGKITKMSQEDFQKIKENKVVAPAGYDFNEFSKKYGEKVAEKYKPIINTSGYIGEKVGSLIERGFSVLDEIVEGGKDKYVDAFYGQPVYDDEGNVKWGYVLKPDVLVGIVGETISQMFPGLAAYYLTGSSIPLGIYMGSIELDQANKDFLEGFAEQKGVSVEELDEETKADAFTQAFAYASLSYILEVMPFKGLEKIEPRVARGFLQRAIKEVPADVLKQMIKEGGTEAMQQFLQNVVAKYGGSNPDRDLMEGVAFSGYVGAMTGAPFGVIPSLTAPRGTETQLSQDTISGEPGGKVLAGEQVGIYYNQSIKDFDLLTDNAELSNIKLVENGKLNPKIQERIINDLKAKFEGIENVGQEINQQVDSKISGKKFTSVETFSNKIKKVIKSALPKEDITYFEKITTDKSLDSQAKIKTEQPTNVNPNIIPREDVIHLKKEADNQGVGEEFVNMFSKPITQKDLNRFNENQTAVLQAGLESAVGNENLTEGVIVNNLEAIKTGVVSPQPRTVVTPKTEVDTQSLIGKTKNVEVGIKRLTELDKAAQEEGIDRGSKSFATRENLRKSISESLQKDATSFVNVSEGKNQAPIFNISYKKIPTKEGSKWGYSAVLNTPEYSKAINYIPKFKSATKVRAMAIQGGIRMIQDARIAGVPSKQLTKAKQALLAANKKLEKKKLPVKKVKKVVKETNKKVSKVTKAKPKKATKEKPIKVKKAKKEGIKVKHFTKKENLKKIIKEGFDTNKPPIFGMKGFEKGKAIYKAGGKDILYFTQDEKRWNKATVYVGEGKGTIDDKYYDYENQKWVIEKNAYNVVGLEAIEATIKPNAKILHLSLDEYINFIEKNLNKKFNRYSFLEDLVKAARKKNFDVIKLNRKKDWTSNRFGKNKYGQDDWYDILTGGSGNVDYFILNKDVLFDINIVGEKKTTKKKIKKIVKKAKKLSEIKTVAEAKKQVDILTEPYGGMTNWYKIPEEIQAKINDFNRKILALREQEKQAERGSLINASVGAVPIGKFMEVPATEVVTSGDKFNLGNEVLSLIRKYAERIGEGYLPRGTVGIFKERTNTIRIKGLNSISTAVHEIAHFLDISKIKLSEKVEKEFKRNDEIRVQFKNLYMEYYPGAKKYHKLNKKIKEGFAVFMQKYSENPQEIEVKYPELVEAILYENGVLHHPLFNEIVFDVRQIIRQYQLLPPLKKIGARVNYEIRKVGKKLLNPLERIKYNLFDEALPTEKVNRYLSDLIHLNKRTPLAILANNLEGETSVGKKYVGYHRMVNGSITKTLDFTWKDLVNKVYKKYEIRRRKITKEEYEENKLKNLENGKDFDSFLIARRKYFDYQERDTSKETLKILKNELKSLKEMFGKDLMLVEGVTKLIADIEKAKKELEYIENVIKNDEMTRKEATEGYDAGKERFEEEAEMFDKLTSEDLEFAHDPMVQKINNEQYAEYRTKVGYAPLKRKFYDEIIGDKLQEIYPDYSRSGTKISSFFRRQGSSREFESPMMSAMRNHREIIKAGMKQMVYNRVAEVAPANPDYFDAVNLKVVKRKDGSIYFPQEKDPNIIMAMRNHKRTPIVVDKFIKKAIDNCLTPDNVGYLSKFLLFSNKLFTRGTTGAFLQFGTVTNPFLDQPTLAAQSTRQKAVIPFYTTIKDMLRVMSNKEGNAYRYAMEYIMLGGQYHTLSYSLSETSKDYLGRLNGEVKGLKKFVEGIDKSSELVFDKLTYLSSKTEMASRLVEYIGAREAGKDQITSFELAGRVTTPFHHRGAWFGSKDLQVLVSSVPFLNANLQVVRMQAEKLTESPQSRKRFLTVMGLLTLAQVASQGLTLALGGDEEKRKLLGTPIESLSQFMFLPVGGKIVKIRIPEQLGIVGTIINMVMLDAFLNAEYTPAEYYEGATSFLPTQFNLPKAFMTKEGFTQLGLTSSPQAIKLFFELALGKRTYPNITDLVSYKYQKLEPKEQYTESSSLVMRKLGKVFNFSPIKGDYLITGIFGRMFKYFLLKPDAFSFENTVLLKEYFYNTRQLQDFFEIRDEVDKKNATIKKYEKEGKYSEVKKYNRDKLFNQTNTISKIEKILDELKDIDEQKFPVRAEAKRKQIFELVRELKTIK